MGEKKINYTLIVSISIVLLLIVLWVAFFYWNLETKLEHRAQIGDSFGSLNALFSALALAGVVITIILQSRELGLQRDELKETRKEFQIQNETLKIQRFENTFFSLLNLHHQIVTGIDHERTVQMRNPMNSSQFQSMGKKELDSNLTNSIIKGRDVFKYSFTKLKTGLDLVNPLPNESIKFKYQ
jgi:hypothetical protein